MTDPAVKKYLQLFSPVVLQSGITIGNMQVEGDVRTIRADLFYMFLGIPIERLIWSSGNRDKDIDPILYGISGSYALYSLLSWFIDDNKIFPALRTTNAIGILLTDAGVF